MKPGETELSYRKSAIEGASPIGLMIVLFDTLVRDLRSAALALRRDDIESRCRHLSHAYLVLGQLESWLDLERGGEAAKTLTVFYAQVRSKMMEAGVRKSAEVLDAQIEAVVKVIVAWRHLDSATEVVVEPSLLIRELVQESKVDRIPFSQSA